MLIGNVNISPLLKAFMKLENFSIDCKTERDKAGLVQAFEYTYELSWKVMKRLLKERGREVNSPREVFRIAALEGFISDPEIWFEFVKARNISIHTYEEDVVDKLLPVIKDFANELRAFLNNLGEINA